ncbi:MAG: hypothetical protein R2716_00790 [Microthrixaceae bacterium]
MSAVDGTGVARLVGRCAARSSESGRGCADDSGFVTLRPVPEGVRVVRTDDGGFEVLGREAISAVALST